MIVEIREKDSIYSEDVSRFQLISYEGGYKLHIWDNGGTLIEEFGHEQTELNKALYELWIRFEEADMASLRYEQVKEFAESDTDDVDKFIRNKQFEEFEELGQAVNALFGG